MSRPLSERRSSGTGEKMEAAAAERGPAAAGGVAPLRPRAAAVPERLQRREAERQREAERRRQEKAAQAVQEEQSGFFAAAFSRERAAIEALLGPGPGQAEAEEALEEAAARLQGLQKLLTDSVRFLAPYEVRQAQEALSRLQGALTAKRQSCSPRSDSPSGPAGRRRSPPRRPPRPASCPRSPPRRPPRPASCPRSPPRRPPRPASCSRRAKGAAPPLCGFSRAEAQTLELGPSELLQRDVLLADLSDCRVLLRGNPNTLRVRDCRGCTVLCGPVSTSVLVDGCSDCLLVLACQQLRTHRTRDSRIYLQVTSRAMVEDCSGVRFAPYTWSYPGIEGDYESSGLDRGRNNWNLVDDFDWLARDEPSPNWSVIPEQERITQWD
ncbi:LOW QUALITY PROTEIN: tubulin-specific chaperone C [Gopherus flavomarginatus]|uniref:LOW QUALITY PROTEIN: tubulin-specific chaperone C n=1 Tax=Gopherus flavomarginatus TaxID=286002 RepID=UPI0021CC35C1|nr:LOW QUALITY PROTEIN: tubulin-specific chaperone C [Gopherus flavomarginatus]